MKTYTENNITEYLEDLIRRYPALSEAKESIASACDLMEECCRKGEEFFGEGVAQ